MADEVVMSTKVKASTRRILNEVSKDCGVTRGHLLNLLAAMLDGGVIDMSRMDEGIARHTRKEIRREFGL